MSLNVSKCPTMSHDVTECFSEVTYLPLSDLSRCSFCKFYFLALKNAKIICIFLFSTV